MVPHQPSLIRHPFLYLLPPFAAGIWLASRFPAGLRYLLLASVAAATSAALLRVRFIRASTLLALLATASAGAALARVDARAPRDSLGVLLREGSIVASAPVDLTGRISGAAERAPTGFFLRVAVESVGQEGCWFDASGQVSLLVPVHEFPAQILFEYGDRIAARVVLKREDEFQNPGARPFSEFLAQQGLEATAVARDATFPRRIDGPSQFHPLRILFAWRLALEERILGSFAPETAGVLLAALLGNRNYLSREVAERFREGGTFHLLVISGLHVSFIGGLVYWVLRRALRNRMARFGAATTVLWAYTLAVGAGASVSRAALMFTFAGLGPLVYRRAGALNLLCATGLVQLAWSPRSLWDPSLQLTFISVLAIVSLAWPLFQRLQEIGYWRPMRATPLPPVCAPFLRSLADCCFWSDGAWRAHLQEASYECRLFKSGWAGTLERWHLQWVLRHAVGALLVSTAVQVLLLPFSVVYFHRISPAALVLNLYTGALMAVLCLSAAAALLVARVSAAVAWPLFKTASVASWCLIHALAMFSRGWLEAFRLPHYAGAGRVLYIFYYVVVGLLIALLNRWDPFSHPKSSTLPRVRRAAVMACLALMLAIVLHPFSTPAADGHLHVDFLDVGQGDAALVTFPQGATLLIDGGGRPEFSTGARADQAFTPDRRSIGEGVVSEYLWWKGLDSVDYVLATHAHADHVSGLSDVLRNFGVRSALVARQPEASREFAALRTTLAVEEVPLALVGAGDVLELDGVKAKVLWPPPNASTHAASGNDDSGVLQITMGRRSILMAGDIEQHAERAMWSSGLLSPVDVVKVPHHGSRTSSTMSFVTATCPAVAIVSVGRTSIFGHPHRDVLERWRAAGANVLTTGANGTISLATDGTDISMTSFGARNAPAFR